MKRITAILLALIIAALFCACGTEQNSNSDIDSSDSMEASAEKVSDTNTQAKSLQEIYGDSGIDGLYRISLEGMTGCALNSGYIRDDRVLLNLRKPDGENTENKVLLFDIFEPENAVSRVITELPTEYYLLPEDKVLELNGNGQYKILNNKLETVLECNENCGNYVGCSDAGMVWFFCEQQLTGYSDVKTIVSIDTPAISLTESYVGDKDGIVYFSMRNDDYEPVIGAINTENGEFSVSEVLPRSPVVSGMTISYNANDRWYFASVDEPFTAASFPKSKDTEYLWKVSGITAVTIRNGYEEIGGGYQSSLLGLYDLTNGGLIEVLTEESLGFSSEIQPIDCKDGRMLIGLKSEDELSFELYLYEFGETVSHSGDENYTYFDFSADGTDIGSLASELESKYGVTICYTEEQLDTYEYDYKLKSADNDSDVVNCLKMLDICLGEYPKGFISELNGDLKKGLKIYICDEFEATTSDVSAEPAACVNTTREYLSLCMDVDYWWDLRQNLLHEMMHLCEQRIVEYEVSHDIWFYQYWDNTLNTEKYPYFESYTETPSDSESFDAGTVFGGNDVWFVDNYAKTNALEDRARTLEYTLYDSNAYYYSYEPIMRKAEFVCGLIRKVFPSIAACNEPVFWETRTGIVDMAKFGF